MGLVSWDHQQMRMERQRPANCIHVFCMPMRIRSLNVFVFVLRVFPGQDSAAFRAKRADFGAKKFCLRCANDEASGQFRPLDLAASIRTHSFCANPTFIFQPLARSTACWLAVQIFVDFAASAGKLDGFDDDDDDGLWAFVSRRPSFWILALVNPLITLFRCTQQPAQIRDEGASLH